MKRLGNHNLPIIHKHDEWFWIVKIITQQQTFVSLVLLVSQNYLYHNYTKKLQCQLLRETGLRNGRVRVNIEHNKYGDIRLELLTVQRKYTARKKS